MTPILADERRAAELLCMKRAEFVGLVERGLLPRPCEIGGYKRWRVAELERIASGEAAEDGPIKWR